MFSQITEEFSYFSAEIEGCGDDKVNLENDKIQKDNKLQVGMRSWGGGEKVNVVKADDVILEWL